MTARPTTAAILTGAVVGTALGCWTTYSMATAGWFDTVQNAVLAGQLVTGLSCIAGMSVAAGIAVVADLVKGRR